MSLPLHMYEAILLSQACCTSFWGSQACWMPISSIKTWINTSDLCTARRTVVMRVQCLSISVWLPVCVHACAHAVCMTPCKQSCMRNK